MGPRRRDFGTPRIIISSRDSSPRERDATVNDNGRRRRFFFFRSDQSIRGKIAESAQVDASGNCRPEQPRTLLQEDEEEMIFVLLVAGAFALATLRRFSGTNDYSYEFCLLPDFVVELGIGNVRERPAICAKFQ